MGAKDAVLRTAGSLSTYVRNNPEIVNRATDIWAENNRLSKEIKKLEPVSYTHLTLPTT